MKILHPNLNILIIKCNGTNNKKKRKKKENKNKKKQCSYISIVVPSKKGMVG